MSESPVDGPEGEDDEARAQRLRDEQIRADLARARATDQDEQHAFIRRLGFEELLED